MSVLPAPPAPAPDDLGTLAHALLGALGAAFDAAGIGGDLSRRFLTTGEPVGECGQLVVSWLSVGMRVPGLAPTPTPLRVDNVRSAELTAWVFRCQQGALKGEGRQLRKVSAAAMTADGEAAMRDAVVMHRAVWAAKRAGTFGDFGRAMSIGDAAPLQPEGGVCGVWMPVVVQLS